MVEGVSMTRPRLHVDHLVWVVQDLDEGIVAFEALTGVRPVIGGRHLGIGTHNALVTLGDRQYIELLAWDPSQPHVYPWLGVDSLELPKLTAFCAEPDDVSWRLESLTERAREHAGYEAGSVVELSRLAHNGGTLKWRLAADNHKRGFSELPGGGLVPFLIDWSPNELPHPAQEAEARTLGCSLVELCGWHPEPTVVQAILAALGADVCFSHGIQTGTVPRLEAVLDSPKGRVVLK